VATVARARRNPDVCSAAVPAAAKPCPFCAVVAGTAPAFRVLDDDVSVAFLDTRPLFPGHTLLVPRAHVETLIDLPTDQVEPLFTRAQRLARAMEEGLGAAGSFVAMNNRVSQSVAHLHVHVVPRQFKDGLRGFFWPRTKYASDAEATDVAGRLREALAAQHPAT
jgi:histidine triad (HIT) family protein